MLCRDHYTAFPIHPTRNSNPLEKAYRSDFHPPSVQFHRLFGRFVPVYGVPPRNPSASKKLYITKLKILVLNQFLFQNCMMLLIRNGFLTALYILGEKIHHITELSTNYAQCINRKRINQTFYRKKKYYQWKFLDSTYLYIEHYISSKLLEIKNLRRREVTKFRNSILPLFSHLLRLEFLYVLPDI